MSLSYVFAAKANILYIPHLLLHHISIFFPWLLRFVNLDLTIPLKPMHGMRFHDFKFLLSYLQNLCNNWLSMSLKPMHDMCFHHFEINYRFLLKFNIFCCVLVKSYMLQRAWSGMLESKAIWCIITSETWWYSGFASIVKN